MEKGQVNVIVSVLIILVVLVGFLVIYNVNKSVVSSKSSQAETGIQNFIYNLFSPNPECSNLTASQCMSNSNCRHFDNGCHGQFYCSDITQDWICDDIYMSMSGEPRTKLCSWEGNQCVGGPSFIACNEVDNRELAEFDLSEFCTCYSEDSCCDLGGSCWPENPTLVNVANFRSSNLTTKTIYLDSCAVLNQSGKNYYLEENLTKDESASNCLNIQAGNLTLDCRGYSITSNNLRGALININSKDNILIKNCILNNDYGELDSETSYGIKAYGSNNIIYNTQIKNVGSGIAVYGKNNLIQNNIVENSVKAISLRGDGNIVFGNEISNNKAGQGWGLSSWKGENNQFIENQVYGNNYGIVLYASSNSVLKCNQFSGNVPIPILLDKPDNFTYNTYSNPLEQDNLPGLASDENWNTALKVIDGGAYNGQMDIYENWSWMPEFASGVILKSKYSIYAPDSSGGWVTYYCFNYSYTGTNNWYKWEKIVSYQNPAYSAVNVTMAIPSVCISAGNPISIRTSPGSERDAAEVKLYENAIYTDTISYDQSSNYLSNYIQDVYVYADNWYNLFDKNRNITYYGNSSIKKYIGNGAEFIDMGRCSSNLDNLGNMTAEETAVYALLKYSNTNPEFTNVLALSRAQRQGLSNALDELEEDDRINSGITETINSSKGDRVYVNGQFDDVANAYDGNWGTDAFLYESNFRITGDIYTNWTWRSGFENGVSLKTKYDLSYYECGDMSYYCWNYNSNKWTLIKTLFYPTAGAGTSTWAIDSNCISYGKDVAIKTSPVVYFNEIHLYENAVVYDSPEEVYRETTGKNFVVFNKEVVILEKESDVKVYNTGDLIWLEIFSKGTSKGRILLGNLTGINTLRDCSIYYAGGAKQNAFTYSICYAENYAKQNPAALIGQETNLVNYIHNYLISNIPNFESDYQFSAYDSTIEVSPVNSSWVGMFLQEFPYAYDRATILNMSKDYVSLIYNVDDPASFFVIDKNYFNSERTEVLKESYVLRNEFSGVGTAPGINFGITGAAVLDSSDDDPFYETKYNPSYNCSYIDQYYDIEWRKERDPFSDWSYGSYLPCNDRVLFTSAYEVMRMNVNWDEENINIILKSLERLKALGYKVDEIAVDTPSRMFLRTSGDVESIIRALSESRHQILVTYSHGTDEGKIGPFACFRNKEEYHNSALLRKGGFCWAGDRCLPDSYSGCYGGEGVAIFVRIGNLRQNKGKIAIHAAAQCYGASYNPIAFKVFTTPYSAMWLSRGAKDIELFIDYLNGNGPEKKYYKTYPPLARSIYPEGNGVDNVHALNVMDFGGPAGVLSGLSIAQSVCFLGLPMFRVPCDLEISDATYSPPDVHLFPYVYDFRFIDYYEGIEQGKYWGAEIKFSDRVSRPKISLNGDKVPNKVYWASDYSWAAPYWMHSPYESDYFGFNLPIELQILSESDYYNVLNDKYQGAAPKIVQIEVSGAKAAVGNGEIEMVGNVLARSTMKNTNHGKSFWYYDPFFWNYNARYPEDNKYKRQNTFIARFPYRLHPYVISPSPSSVSFSVPVKNTIINVDASECVQFAGEKPFEPGGAPRWDAENGEYRWHLRGGRDQIVIISPDDLTDEDFYGTYGTSKKNWDHHLKITVSNAESQENRVKMFGNIQSWSKKSYDSDGKNGRDYYEKDPSHYFPQIQGSFMIEFPCADPTGRFKESPEAERGTIIPLDTSVLDPSAPLCSGEGTVDCTFLSGCPSSHVCGDPFGIWPNCRQCFMGYHECTSGQMTPEDCNDETIACELQEYPCYLPPQVCYLMNEAYSYCDERNACVDTRINTCVGNAVCRVDWNYPPSLANPYTCTGNECKHPFQGCCNRVPYGRDGYVLGDERGFKECCIRYGEDGSQKFEICDVQTGEYCANGCVKPV